MWMPGIERAEPRRRLSSTFAKAITGRRDALFYAACDEAYYALVPAFVVEADATALDRWARVAQLAHGGQRFGLHARFDRAAFFVQFVQARRQLCCCLNVVGEQATDADAHVVEAAGGVEARGDAECQVGGGEIFPAALGDFE